jgi:hypothetical protein
MEWACDQSGIDKEFYSAASHSDSSDMWCLFVQ